MATPHPTPYTLRTSDLAQRLLTYYAATLLERGQLGLAPPYLCCLRPGLRGQLAGELLAAHTRRLTGRGGGGGEERGGRGELNQSRKETVARQGELQLHKRVVVHHRM